MNVSKHLERFVYFEQFKQKIERRVVKTNKPAHRSRVPLSRSGEKDLERWKILLPDLERVFLFLIDQIGGSSERLEVILDFVDRSLASPELSRLYEFFLLAP